VREEKPGTDASAPVEEPSEAAALHIFLQPLRSRDGRPAASHIVLLPLRRPAAHAKTPVAPVGPWCVYPARGRHR